MNDLALMTATSSLVFFLGASLNVGFEWTGKISKDDNVLFLLAAMFGIAAAFAALASMLKIGVSPNAARGLSPNAINRWSFLLIISTSIGLPCSFIATRSALGASRNQFVDYSLTPLSTLAIGYLLDDEISNSRYLAVGIAACLIGCVAMVSSLWRVAPEGQSSWPFGLNLTGSLLLGISCAIISSISGALSLLFMHRLGSSHDPEVVLWMRLTPCALVLLALGVISSNQKIYISIDGIFISCCLGFLLFVYMWLLFVLLRKQTLVAIAPFLFLIPLFTFLLSLFPFRFRKFDDVPRFEWYGMSLVIVGLALVEGGR